MKRKHPLPFFSGEWARIAGAIAKRLCNGLQIRLVRFDSGSRLHPLPVALFGLPSRVFAGCCADVVAARFEALRPL